MFGIRWEVLVLDLLMVLAAVSYYQNLVKCAKEGNSSLAVVSTIINSVIFGGAIAFYWHLTKLLLPGAGS